MCCSWRFLCRLSHTHSFCSVFSVAKPAPYPRGVSNYKALYATFEVWVWQLFLFVILFYFFLCLSFAHPFFFFSFMLFNFLSSYINRLITYFSFPADFACSLCANISHRYKCKYKSEGWSSQLFYIQWKPTSWHFFQHNYCKRSQEFPLCVCVCVCVCVDPSRHSVGPVLSDGRRQRADPNGHRFWRCSISCASSQPSGGQSSGETLFYS